MEGSDDNTHASFAGLKSSLATLIEEYRQARNLINEQIQAVVSNDLAQLDTLVEQQLSKYERLEKREEEFKHHLEDIFQDVCPGESKHSLTVLMEKLRKPSRELNKLRTELHQQVEKTQELREQLMELLQFASRHNVEIFEEIFQLGNDGSESYGADGKKKQGSVGSMAINRKA